MANDRINFTATGRYYKVYRNGEFVSQHTTEREASQKAANELLQDNAAAVHYTHDYVVEAEFVAGDEPEPPDSNVVIPVPTRVRNTIVTPGAAALTITNHIIVPRMTPPVAVASTLALGASSYTIDENTAGQFLVNRVNGWSQVISVDWSITGASVTPSSGTVTFQAGEGQQTVNVVGDAVTSTEIGTLTLTNGVNLSGGPAPFYDLPLTASFTVTAAPVAADIYLNLNSSTYSGNENAVVSFTVQRSGALGITAVSVDWALTGVAATPSSGTVTFAEDDSQVQVSVAAGLVASDTSGTLTLSNPQNLSGQAPLSISTIPDITLNAGSTHGMEQYLSSQDEAITTSMVGLNPAYATYDSSTRLLTGVAPGTVSGAMLEAESIPTVISTVTLGTPFTASFTVNDVPASTLSVSQSIPPIVLSVNDTHDMSQYINNPQSEVITTSMTGLNASYATYSDTTKLLTGVAAGTTSNVQLAVATVVASSQAIDGWTSITAAIDATGSGTRYDVTDNASFEAVPWNNLTPGSVVNIFYRAEPYKYKVVLSEVGTEANPIIINGVTDANGNRPVISGNGATTLNSSAHNSTLNRLSVWAFYQDASIAVYASQDGPQWWQVNNLRFTAAHPDYASDAGTYYSGAAGIRVNNAKSVRFNGCIFDDCSNGMFARAHPNITSLLTSDIHVRGCKFENNGTVGSYLEHGAYLSAVSIGTEKNIIEGCYFGSVRSGSAGMSIKTRMTDTVFRYNTVASSARAFEIAEAQDGAPAYIVANYSNDDLSERVHASYVYGNVFINDVTTGNFGWYALHFGFDGAETLSDGRVHRRGYTKPTYFFNNTLNYVSDSYYAGIFSTDGAGDNPSSYPGKVTAINNIISLDGSNTRWGHKLKTGTATYEGANLIHTSTGWPVYESGSYANTSNTGDDPSVTINNNDTRLTVAPLFTDAFNADIEARNFTPVSGAAAKNAATTLPAELNAYPVLLQPVAPASGGGAVIRETTNDLGAIE